MRQWVIDGQRLGAIGRGVAWWLGDWLRFGNAKFGERYVRASRITGYDVQTLMNIVYVTSRFEACRRREKLSWSHHAELAALDPDEQDRWLGRAETQRLSVRDLRAEVRRATRPRKARRAMPSEAGGDEVTVSPAQARLPSAREELVCPHCGHEFAVASAAVASRNGHALDPVDR